MSTAAPNTRRILPLRPIGRDELVVVGGFLVAGVLGLATGWNPFSGLALVALVIAIAAFLVPPRWLLWAAIAVAFLVPMEVLPIPGNGAPVASIPIAFWLVRSAGRVRVTGLALAGGFLGLLLLISQATAWMQAGQGISSTVALGIACWALLSGAKSPTIETIPRVYTAGAAFLGAYAVIEKWVLHDNPIYGRFYETAGWSAVGGEIYRSTTSIGHPLANGTVFAVAAVFAAHRVLSTSSKIALLQTALVLGGLAATLSRGAVLACGAGMLALLLFSTDTRSHRKLTLVAVLAIGAATFGGAFLARDRSEAGQISASARASSWNDTQEALGGREVFGVGPGMSQRYRNFFSIGSIHQYVKGVGWQVAPIENAWAQMLVSIGWLGGMLFVAINLWLVVRGLRDPRSAPAAAALLTFGVAIFFYSALEGTKALIAIMTLLWIQCQTVSVPRGPRRRAAAAVQPPVPAARGRATTAA